LRSTEQSDYTRLYDLQNPFLQEFGGITYLPEYFSLIAEDALVKPLEREARFNSEGTEADAEILKFRKRALERLILIDQPSLSRVKDLSKMALGLDDYQPIGATAEARFADWKTKITKGMKVIDKTGVKRLRLPEFWKDVTADHLGLAQTDLETAWRNFNFSSWLRQEGLSEEEIVSKPVVGIRGWERFKEHASLRLVHMMEAQYRDYDKAFRYLIKVGGNLEALEKLFSLNLAGVAMGSEKVGDVGGLNDAQARPMIVGIHNKFVESLKVTGEELIIGDFVQNDVAQRMYRAVIQGFMDTNCAWNMDTTFVEDVELDKVGAGSTFSLQRITKEKFNKRWSGLVGDRLASHGVLPFLQGFQMYFVNPVETDEKQAVMVGPQTGFIPEVVRTRQLYHDLREVTGSKLDERIQEIGEDSSRRDPECARLRIFIENLGLYEEEGYHSWNRLRDGAWTIPPDDIGTLVEAVDRKANLANAYTEQLVEELNSIATTGKINRAAIADNGWRFEFKHPGVGTKLWYIGYPEISPIVDMRIWRDKKGRKK
jgi:hypothetical protein